MKRKCSRCFCSFVQATTRRSTCSKCTYLIRKEAINRDPGYWKKWYYRHHEAQKKKALDYYWRNHEKSKQRRKRYYAEHRAEILAYMRRWYLENRPHQMRMTLKWQQDNPNQKRKLLKSIVSAGSIFSLLQTGSILKTHGTRKQN